MRWRVSLMVGLLLSSASDPAIAEPSTPSVRCPLPRGAQEGLGRFDARTRWSYLSRELRKASDSAELWRWSWFSAGLGIVGFQGIAAGVSDGEARLRFAILAGLSTTVPLRMLFRPLEVSRLSAEAERLEHLWEPIVPCPLVAAAENLLARGAEDERVRTGFWGHALAVGSGLAVGLIIGIPFDWKLGLLNGLGATAIGEGQLLTQPHRASRALQRYRAGELGPASAASGFGMAPLGWVFWATF